MCIKLFNFNCLDGGSEVPLSIALVDDDLSSNESVENSKSSKRNAKHRVT